MFRHTTAHDQINPWLSTSLRTSRTVRRREPEREGLSFHVQLSYDHHDVGNGNELLRGKMISLANVEPSLGVEPIVMHIT